MTRQDRILQLVLSDENLIKKYQIDPADYPSLYNALQSENPIVASIAMIIDSVKDDFDESSHKNLYTRIQRHLNDTLLL